MSQQRRIILLCVKEPEGTWYPWYSMTEATWEAGGEDWGPTPPGQSTQEVWINIDANAIQTACDVPDVEGTVELPTESHK